MRDVMRLKTLLASGLCVLAMSGGLAWAQNAATPAPAVAATLIPADAAWTIAPENLLVIDTNKGRILVGLDPRLAPQSVERIRSLADRGFYDGLAWHRVMAGFMAQTGDPLGTGAGSSDLPDLTAEFQFRRGRDAGFVTVPESGSGTRGIMGFMPLQTQPDAQMMFTADGRTDAMGLFCTGIAGMGPAARASGSQGGGIRRCPVRGPRWPHFRGHAVEYRLPVRRHCRMARSPHARRRDPGAAGGRPEGAGDRASDTAHRGRRYRIA